MTQCIPLSRHGLTTPRWLHPDRNDRGDGGDRDLIGRGGCPSAVEYDTRTQRAVDDRAALPKIAAALKRGMLREQRISDLRYECVPACSAPPATMPITGGTWRPGMVAGSANEARYPLGTIPGRSEYAEALFRKGQLGRSVVF